MGDIYTPEEIALQWRLEPATVRRWIREGKLKATKLGRGWRVKREDWESFIQAQEVASKKADALALAC